MKNELLRNGSGYIDPTAYAAMKNVEKEQRKMYKRGQIYEYEVKPGDIRVALVVSADFRAKDDVLNVIILGDGYGSETCVGVGGYVADCCMVSFAWASKMGKYIGKANAEEMDCIDAEIMKCLGIERKEKPKAITPPAETRTDGVELAKAQTEARVYRELYDRLLAVVAGGGES